jgi:hypothetical protein
MTDAIPKTAERFDLQQPDNHMGLACMQAEPYGDYVRHSDYAALSAQLEAANAELARISRDNEFEAWAGKCQRECDAANQRAKQAQLDAENWARLAARADDAAETARAEGKAEGLREAAKRLRMEYNISNMWVNGLEVFGSDAATPAACYKTILALIPASTAEPAQCCICGTTDISTEEDGGPECQLSDTRWTCGRDCYDEAIRAIAGGKDE